MSTPTIRHNTILPDPYTEGRLVSFIFVEDEPRLRLEGDGRDVHAFIPRWDAGHLRWERIQWHQPDSVRNHEQARRWWVNAYTDMETAA